MGKFHVVATVTLVTPRQHAGKIFEQVVSGADVGAQCLAGASRLPHDAGLVYKSARDGDRARHVEGPGVLGSRAARGDRRANTGGTAMGITAIRRLCTIARRTKR
jgi:hypothetical protein